MTATIEKQEEQDFITASIIMKNIFEKYNKTATLKRNKPYSPVDTKMYINDTWRYNLEIKERQQDMNKYHTLPLKVTKYCDIQDDTPNNVTPLIIYLLNDTEYYIFNLNKLDFNKIRIRNWNINKKEFTNFREKQNQPTMFLPLNQSVYHGEIHIQTKTKSE